MTASNTVRPIAKRRGLSLWVKGLAMGAALGVAVLAAGADPASAQSS